MLYDYQYTQNIDSCRMKELLGRNFALLVVEEVGRSDSHGRMRSNSQMAWEGARCKEAYLAVGLAAEDRHNRIQVVEVAAGIHHCIWEEGVIDSRSLVVEVVTGAGIEEDIPEEGTAAEVDILEVDHTWAAAVEDSRPDVAPLRRHLPREKTLSRKGK